MAESQSHGVLFEDTVIRSITGRSKTAYEREIANGYTSAFDIHRDILSDFNGSVKTTGGDGIGCGDIARFLSHAREHEFLMIIGEWRQVEPTVKHYHRIREYKFSPDLYKRLFGELTPELVQPFVDWVKSVPAGKQAQLQARPVYKARRAQLQREHDCGIASIDVKIDSKNQRRVQLGLRMSDLDRVGVPCKVYTDDYRGISLPYEQESKPRQFKRA